MSIRLLRRVDKSLMRYGIDSPNRGQRNVNKKWRYRLVIRRVLYLSQHLREKFIY